MSQTKTNVLVVDDSAVLRELITDMINATPDMQVVGAARDGIEALDKIQSLRPDVVTLDVQMPRMNGLQTLDAILKQDPLPVIMVSSVTQRDAETTLQALERGALDYIAKPGDLQELDGEFRHQLLHKLRVMAKADVKRVLRVRQTRATRPAAPTASKTENQQYAHACVALGISTGGPPALSRLFQHLHPPLPPIVIVQHMPANFTAPFASRLNLLSELSVKEAADGDTLKPDCAYVAPGGKHLRLRRMGSTTVCRIVDEEPYSGHKPSVDLMMKDAADIFGQNCVGVIMTGMGHDGAQGCGDIRAAGGYVFGQDEESSDVYGMNKVAFTSGHVDRQFSADQLPHLLTSACKRFARTLRPGSPTALCR